MVMSDTMTESDTSFLFPAYACARVRAIMEKASQSVIPSLMGWAKGKREHPPHRRLFPDRHEFSVFSGSR